MKVSSREEAAEELGIDLTRRSVTYQATTWQDVCDYFGVSQGELHSMPYGDRLDLMVLLDRVQPGT